MRTTPESWRLILLESNLKRVAGLAHEPDIVASLDTHRRSTVEQAIVTPGKAAG